jgi:hypothetical protein
VSGNHTGQEDREIRGFRQERGIGGRGLELTMGVWYLLYFDGFSVSS